MSEKIEKMAKEIIDGLYALADPIRAEGERRYFKETINPFGVTAGPAQKLEKTLCKGIEKSWTVAEAFILAEILLDKRIFEVSQFVYNYLFRFAETDLLTETELNIFEKWIEVGYVDNWAATDNLGTHVIGAMIEKHPEFTKKLKIWAKSDNRWLRRISIVSFVLVARKGLLLDDVYEIAEILIEDKNDDLVQKGNGWTLREAGKTDPDRLTTFLLKHGPNIPRTTLRYAIERFPKEKRVELLSRTRLGLGVRD